MQPRQSVPRRWLMTDERMGDALWRVLRRLPPGSGIVFRHYATPAADRRAIFRRVARIAMARRLLLVIGGASAGGAAFAAHGGTTPISRRHFSASAHRRQDACRAQRAGVTVLFVSPIHATRSHPDALVLGPFGGLMVGGGLGLALIALGGMDDRRWRRLRGFHGWAGIDAWL